MENFVSLFLPKPIKKQPVAHTPLIKKKKKKKKKKEKKKRKKTKLFLRLVIWENIGKNCFFPIGAVLEILKSKKKNGKVKWVFFFFFFFFFDIRIFVGLRAWVLVMKVQLR